MQYYIHASNGKGHGVHSPFVFNFIKQVLNNREEHESYEKIEELRKELLGNGKFIEVEDFGAGSAVIKTNKRAIDKIAASSLKHRKFAQLLHRIVAYYKPAIILELGTSFGTTTAYMASANPAATLYTMEGAASIAEIAQQNFDKLELKNIKLIQGDFQQTLPALFKSLQQIDLAFIDGNHRKVPTLEYFHQLLQRSTGYSILIFDDIHWSPEMEEAWAEIQQHPAVTSPIDLFFIGLVFVNPDFKIQQHFLIRF